MTESDGEMREILEQARVIAVVGIKDSESEDAYRIPKYLHEQGYTVIPVNPKVREVLGRLAVSSLLEVTEPVDVVDLFRASDNVPEHVEEILAMPSKPRAVWMQLGIHHGPAAQKLREAGIGVIQDRCIMVEHRRLVAGRD